MPTPHYFILGSTPALSLLELQRYFADPTLTEVAQGVVKLELADNVTAGEVLLQLGGTVKIARELEVLDRDASQETIYQAIAAQLQAVSSSEKITFGLGELGRNHLDSLSVDAVKDLLKKADKRARYIEAPRSGLSAAVLLHHTVSEILVIRTSSKTVLALTESVQNIDTWTKVDREKPYADRKKGMLPPKIARIMINLACGQTHHPEAVLLDPFCGSGTVLLEAAARSIEVIGTDLDKDAVEGTLKNLEWFKTSFGAIFEFSVFQADATKVQVTKKVNYLVTEPFLGKPKPAAHQVANIFKGLEKMYLGAFKHWRSILLPGATVVIIFPRALSEGTGLKNDVSLDSLIDKLKTLGYTPILEPVLYHRPQAVIGREIRVFEFQPVQQ